MLCLSIFGYEITINAVKRQNRYTNSKKSGKIKQRGDGGLNMSMVFDVTDTTVFDVADYFLSQERPDKRWDITHLKLQKLVYYAQGWSLALRNDRPLFLNEIEAWAHGPVCPELYRKYRRFGFGSIPKIENYSRDLNEDDRRLLTAVWSKYGFRDARALEFMTHEESPWKDAWSNIEARSKGNKTITLDNIEAFFSSLISR